MSMNNREIKFRAWDKSHGVMRYFGDKDYMQGFGLNGFFVPTDENCVVMQFTGLLDKNGKDVYEGDLVVGVYGKESWEVVYEAPEFRFSRRNEQRGGSASPGYWRQIEVIGNVFENPDLLK